jgi:hypothetical protein
MNRLGMDAVQLPNCILDDRAFAQERAPSLLALGLVSFSSPQESGKGPDSGDSVFTEIGRQ